MARRPKVPMWAVRCMGGGVAITMVLVYGLVDVESQFVRLAAAVAASALVVLVLLGVVRLLARRRA
jgi:hypothetical protein